MSATRWRGGTGAGVRCLGEGRAVGLAGYTPNRTATPWSLPSTGCAYVDDSKATNPHAALASLVAYPRIVWVAGGQLKGVDVDDLVATVAGRLVGAVLLGVDRGQIGAGAGATRAAGPGGRRGQHG